MALPSVPAEDGLTAYFRDVWKFPMLEQEEECSLAVRWRDEGDMEAAHKLVTSHLRLVAKIAVRYRGYGLPLSDLVAEGNIGLMKAVKKFDPERGFRLSTYAMWWIRASITEYVLRSWSLVKTGTLAAQKKLFFSLNKLRKTLKVTDNAELAPRDVTYIARQMNVPEQDVVDISRRLSVKDMSLNAPVSKDEGAAELRDILADGGPTPEAVVAEREEGGLRRTFLEEALEGLSERDRHIFTERRLKDQPVTLEELGVHYGISRERIRQLEARAFDRVKKAVLEAARRVGEGVPELPALSAPVG